MASLLFVALLVVSASCSVPLLWLSEEPTNATAPVYLAANASINASICVENATSVILVLNSGFSVPGLAQNATFHRIEGGRACLSVNGSGTTFLALVSASPWMLSETVPVGPRFHFAAPTGPSSLPVAFLPQLQTFNALIDSVANAVPSGSVFFLPGTHVVADNLRNPLNLIGSAAWFGFSRQETTVRVSMRSWQHFLNVFMNESIPQQISVQHCTVEGTPFYWSNKNLQELVVNDVQFLVGANSGGNIEVMKYLDIKAGSLLLQNCVFAPMEQGAVVTTVLYVQNANATLVGVDFRNLSTNNYLIHATENSTFVAKNTHFNGVEAKQSSMVYLDQIGSVDCFDVSFWNCQSELRLFLLSFGMEAVVENLHFFNTRTTSASLIEVMFCDPGATLLMQHGVFEHNVGESSCILISDNLPVTLKDISFFNNELEVIAVRGLSRVHMIDCFVSNPDISAATSSLMSVTRGGLTVERLLVQDFVCQVGFQLMQAKFSAIDSVFANFQSTYLSPMIAYDSSVELNGSLFQDCSGTTANLLYATFENNVTATDNVYVNNTRLKMMQPAMIRVFEKSSLEDSNSLYIGIPSAFEVASHSSGRVKNMTATGKANITDAYILQGYFSTLLMEDCIFDRLSGPEILFRSFSSTTTAKRITLRRSTVVPLFFSFPQWVYLYNMFLEDVIIHITEGVALLTPQQFAIDGWWGNRLSGDSSLCFVLDPEGGTIRRYVLTNSSIPMLGLESQHGSQSLQLSDLHADTVACSQPLIVMLDLSLLELARAVVRNSSSQTVLWLISESSDITLTTVEISTSTSAFDILSVSVSDVALHGLFFDENRLQRSGIWVKQSDLVLDSVVLSGSVPLWGTSIVAKISDSRLSMNQGRLQRNRGVYVMQLLYSSLDMNGTLVEWNAVNMSALSVEYDQSSSKTTSFVSVSNSVFSHNSGWNGAACNLSPGALGVLEVVNSRFEDNVGSRGGALYVSSGKHVTLSSCQFLRNTASNSGGALYSFYTPALDVHKCVFRDNRGLFCGGAVYTHWTAAAPNFTDCQPPMKRAQTQAELKLRFDHTAGDIVKVFLNNSALTGPDVSADEIRLELFPTSNGSSVEDPLEIASGTGFSARLALVDYYGNPLLPVDIQYRKISKTITAFARLLSSTSDPPAMLGGSRISSVDSTSFHFDGLEVAGNPGSVGVLEFALSGPTRESGVHVAADTNLHVHYKARDCHLGEAVTARRCVPCDAGTFGWLQNSSVCAQCPQHAVCFGTHVMPLQGYWRFSRNVSKDLSSGSLGVCSSSGGANTFSPSTDTANCKMVECPVRSNCLGMTSMGSVSFEEDQLSGQRLRFVDRTDGARLCRNLEKELHGRSNVTLVLQSSVFAGVTAGQCSNNELQLNGSAADFAGSVNVFPVYLWQEGCKTGYSGHLCAQCESGYGMTLEECSPCLNPWLSVLLLLLLIVALVGILLVTFWTSRRSARHVFASYQQGVDFDTVWMQQARLSVLIKIVLSTWQMSSLAARISLAWPSAIRGFFMVQDSVTCGSSHISLGFVDCLSQDLVPDGVFWQLLFRHSQFILFLPLLLVPLCLLGSHIFSKLDKRRTERRRKLLYALEMSGMKNTRQAHALASKLPEHMNRPVKPKTGAKRPRMRHNVSLGLTSSVRDSSQVENSVLVRWQQRPGFQPGDYLVLSTVCLIFLLLPTLCRSAFSLFSCMGISCGFSRCNALSDLRLGDNYLRSALNIRCDASEHLVFRWLLGVPAICLYVIGVPLGCFLVLYFKKAELVPDARDDNASIVQKNMMQLGFMYYGLRHECYYWEILAYIRKIALVAIVELWPPSEGAVQAVLASCVVLFSLLLHQAFKPYGSQAMGVGDPILDRMEMASLTLTLLTFLSGILHQDAGETLVRALTAYAVVIGHTSFILASAYFVLPEIKRRVKTVVNYFVDPSSTKDKEVFVSTVVETVNPTLEV